MLVGDYVQLLYSNKAYRFLFSLQSFYSLSSNFRHSYSFLYNVQSIGLIRRSLLKWGEALQSTGDRHRLTTQVVS
jgi:hypothetical protein